jgi:hypothetical protein
MTTLALLIAAVLAATPPVASAPELAPTATLDRCASVAALLDALEEAGRAVRTFRAGLEYEKFDALLGESERRFGRVVLEGVDRERRFAFLFDRFYDGGGREEAMRDQWIYAAGWLAEANHDRRVFTKRQIVEPGRTFDPLKLGEGPFPLPFGQPRAEVESRFAAALCEVPDLPRLRSLTDVCGLRLVPKEGTAMAKDTERVEIFYDRATLAPRAVILWARNGDRTTVILSRPMLNQPLAEADRALLVMPEPDPRQWTIDIRPWEGAKDESALAPERSAPASESLLKR